jgi:ABC-type transport system involved in multi-copper enzyme maturation permease subunit
MTALSVPARPGEVQGLRPVPWRRMAWVTWRQHRFALVGVAVLLGVLSVYLWLTGLSMHHAYTVAAACRPADSMACINTIGDFNAAYGSNAQTIEALLHAVPALIGAFVGAPVLARELETGTFRYAWTQGFGRWRWAFAKLVLLAIAVTAAAELFSLLFSWYVQPLLAEPGYQTPLGPGVFDLRGVAFAAWTLAAFAIGITAGMLIRRVVPAIAATLAAWAGLLIAAGLFLRQHYAVPLVTSNPNQADSNAWIMAQWWTKGGTTISSPAMNQIIQSTIERVAPKTSTAFTPDSPDAPLQIAERYLTQHGYLLWTRYQPASRFWSFQWIESGWLLALSVLLIAATIWLVRRRVT